MSDQSRRPSFGRDSVWLASADVVAVLLAFVGQLILARALLSETYCLFVIAIDLFATCLLYTSPSPRDRSLSRMPSSA